MVRQQDRVYDVMLDNSDKELRTIPGVCFCLDATTLVFYKYRISLEIRLEIL